MLLNIKLAIISAILAIFGVTPVWCDSCGEMYLDGQLQTHIFEEVHEYEDEDGIYYKTMPCFMDICSICEEHLG